MQNVYYNMITNIQSYNTGTMNVVPVKIKELITEDISLYPIEDKVDLKLNFKLILEKGFNSTTTDTLYDLYIRVYFIDNTSKDKYYTTIRYDLFNCNNILELLDNEEEVELDFEYYWFSNLSKMLNNDSKWKYHNVLPNNFRIAFDTVAVYKEARIISNPCVASNVYKISNKLPLIDIVMDNDSVKNQYIINLRIHKTESIKENLINSIYLNDLDKDIILRYIQLHINNSLDPDKEPIYIYLNSLYDILIKEINRPMKIIPLNIEKDWIFDIHIPYEEIFDVLEEVVMPIDIKVNFLGFLFFKDLSSNILYEEQNLIYEGLYYQIN